MILALSGFWLVFLSILAFVFIISLIIVFHEFGHFMLARKSGIKCYEFSIGMGPAIYKHQFKETLFCIRAIPLGGYVSMAGEQIADETLKDGDRVGLTIDDNKVIKIDLNTDNVCDIRGVVIEKDLLDVDENGMYIIIADDDNVEHTYEISENAVYQLTAKSSLQVTPYKDTFDSKGLLPRFLTLFAGPLMNFVLAILLYFIYFCAVGVPNYSSTLIGSVGTGYVGETVFNSGDEIVSVNNKTVSSWNEFDVVLDEEYKNNNFNLTIKLKRNGETIIKEISPNIIINSIGLSNLQVNDNTYPDSLASKAIVGNVALRYFNDNKNGKYLMNNGDVITKMRVDTFVSKNNYKEGEVILVNNFDDIVSNLKDVDVAKVYFEYYSVEKAKENPNDPYVKLEDSLPLETWSNETLNNQRINKIDFKLGISPTYHFDFGGVFVSTFKGFWKDFTLIFRTLKLLIAPSGVRQVGVSDLSSVVGIFGMVQNIILGGILPLLSFAAMLSVNIGIMNLLPIPALDGGRIVFLGYELITGRKPNKKFESTLNNVFFILLMILFIYVTFNDIKRIGFIFRI